MADLGISLEEQLRVLLTGQALQSQHEFANESAAIYDRLHAKYGLRIVRRVSSRRGTSAGDLSAIRVTADPKFAQRAGRIYQNVTLLS